MQYAARFIASLAVLWCAGWLAASVHPALFWVSLLLAIPYALLPSRYTGSLVVAVTAAGALGGILWAVRAFPQPVTVVHFTLAFCVQFAAFGALRVRRMQRLRPL